MNKNTSFKIGNAVIQPREHVRLALPIPEIYSCAPLYMPIQVVHGKYQGPTLLVTAATYGDQINGTAIIQRLSQLKLLRRIFGTLIMVPVVNVLGLINRSRFIYDDIVFDAIFPGSESGSNVARLAHTFIEQIASKANYCVDLRTGSLNHDNLSQVQTDMRYEPNLTLARAFQPPVIMQRDASSTSLMKTMMDKEIPTIIYEAGEALRFDEKAIKNGTRGIVSLMRNIGMLPPINLANNPDQSLIARNCRWITAPQSGTVRILKKTGAKISKGERIAIMSDPFGSNPETDIKSEFNGMIVALNNIPLVREGEKLLRIATFTELDEPQINAENTP